jgi:hypothetical protein
VTLTPDPGYRLVAVVDNGVDVISSVEGGTYGATTADADHQLVATFEPDGQVPLVSVQVADSGADAGSSLLVRSASVPIVLTANPVRAGALSTTIVLDGTVVSQSASLLPEGWSGVTFLEEGTHTLVVSVVDESGAVCRKELKLVRDSTGPLLTVDALPSSVYAASIVVTGTVSDAGSGLARLWIAGQAVQAGSDGRFSCKVALQVGVNTIDVTAFDVAENLTTRQFVVTVPKLKEPTVLTLRIGSASMTLDGVSRPIDAQGTMPIISNGTTLVPIRAVVEALGGSVSWQAASNTITMGLGAARIVLRIGAMSAAVDGVDKPLTVPAVILGGRTMIPLRFVIENLGCTVAWDPLTRTVTITGE